MRKEKFRVEYIFNRASKNSLWNSLSTTGGLAEWFADEVMENGNRFTFMWKKHRSEAELIASNPFIYVRFHWLEEEPDTYFEFRLHKIEITGYWMLEITDFAEVGEKYNAIALWDTQVKLLRRRLGL
jgi:hypothetical protein